ncbi:hypothetical protein AYO44_04570 [Planctomycetaceae bacterium SCGC AG-212-F19]|nr:hypothetical protein AYO44_04570 [Planctomycetaceae bacterium SCGC AG-212-F19]
MPAGVRFIGHRKTDLYCDGGNTCGDGDTVLDQIIRAVVTLPVAAAGIRLAGMTLRNSPNLRLSWNMAEDRQHRLRERDIGCCAM